MVIGIGQVDLHIYSARSLKDKRRVVKSIIESSKHKFNISIAEVGDNDKWQVAKIGFATVSNHGEVVNKTLNHVIEFISSHTEVEMTNIEVEIN